MTAKEGWTVFIVAVGSAVAAYFVEQWLTTGAKSAKTLPAVVTASGINAVPSGSVLANSAVSDQADPSAGTAPTPQVQTEAAYNAAGNPAQDVTLGDNTMQTDYEQYDDPYEVAQ